MVIKLVRTDTADASKIQLSLGGHVIGRGNLLGCDDKRISRNHGQLEVSDASLSISALHQNPCFYIKKPSDDIQILKKDSTITLYNGDRFGLLPDTFWYEVINCSCLDTHSIQAGNISQKNTEEYPLEAVNDDCNVHDETSRINPDRLSIDINHEESIDDTKNPESPSLIDPTTSDGIQSNITEENTLENMNVSTGEDSGDTHDSETQNKDPNESNETKSNLQDNPKTPFKRCLIQDQDVAKKIKTEPIEVKTEPEDTKPGSSVDLAQQNAVNDSKQNIPQVQPRERCMYGANCYRKNPVHLSQFSHPRDSDWGDGAQVACPYGAACAKRDPRHHRDHTHPPGYTQPPPRVPGMQVVQRHGNVYYINAHSVNFYEDHLQVVDSDGDSVDYDYEF